MRKPASSRDGRATSSAASELLGKGTLKARGGIAAARRKSRRLAERIRYRDVKSDGQRSEDRGEASDPLNPLEPVVSTGQVLQCAWRH
jgi:hypothetical protein